MQEKLQNILFEKYPKIFQDKDDPVNKSLMSFGIDTGDGWFWLIDNLCQQLQFDTDNNEEVQIIAFQVKEKFGSLRFYVKTCSERQDAIIGFTQFLSCSICEKCGNTKNVKKTNKGYIIPLCENCTKEIKKGM